ncbi:MAG: MBL fold metallo-hydrolase [Candidatus Micrarchaeia archaeon]
MNAIQYFGHATFAITLDDTLCLVNPSIADKINGEKRILFSKFEQSSMRKCDLIFITSEEPEFCDPAIVKAIVERTYASVVAPKPALAKIDVSEKFKVDVQEGDSFSLKGLELSVVKAVHPQAQHPVGYVMKGKKWRVYYSGATYVFAQMPQIKCDIAILPIGGTYAMDPFAAANACKEIRPKYAVPMLYDTTEKLRQRTGEFGEGLPTYTKPLVLRPGNTAKLD